MILFLNFAPYSFGGGVERWILDVAEELSKDEEVVLIEVDHSISNIYSKIVLKRSFSQRLEINSNCKIYSIKTAHFVPFSSQNKQITKLFKTARLIYSKLEVNEIFLLHYFGGVDILKKVVIGSHSPLVYSSKNISRLQSVHNFLYTSSFMRKILEKSKKVHVLTSDQKNTFNQIMQLQNIITIPNFVLEQSPPQNTKSNPNELRILFLGELSKRKGVDILLKVIESSPKKFLFEIIGDGTYKEEIKRITSKNVIYHGYKSQAEIFSILENIDVLLMTSRAEGFSLATLEAMSKGIVVVASTLVTPQEIRKYVEITEGTTTKDYLNSLHKLFSQKSDSSFKNRRCEISDFINGNFSRKQIIEILKKELFV